MPHDNDNDNDGPPKKAMRKGVKSSSFATSATSSGTVVVHDNNNMKKQEDEPHNQNNSSSSQHHHNHHHNNKKERPKNVCTVSARMRQVVAQMLNCDMESYMAALHQTTIFAFKSQQSEIILSFLQEMNQENTVLYQNKEMLMQAISQAYDETKALAVTTATSKSSSSSSCC